MANEEVVNVRMVLDPQGLQSQLDQVRQTISGSLSGMSASLGQTFGSAAVGFNSVVGDVSSFGSVFTSPNNPASLSQLASSAMHGLIPQLTAPHSFDVKEWGDTHRNIVAGTVQKVAMGATIGAVDMAVGSLAQGAAFGLAAGALGLSAGIPAMLGLGLADSFLLGGKISGTADYVSDRIMEPLAVPHMAGQALRFAGPRMGLRGAALDDAADAVRSVQLSSGVTGNEAMEVLSTGLETGAFGQVSGAVEFKSKFKQLMEGAKEITRSMHTELSESVQMLSSLQESGFGSIGGAINAIRMARVSSAMTGLTASESVSVAQAGASMSIGSGMSAQWGAASLMSNMEGVILGQRNKTIDQETIVQLGGNMGAAAAMEASGIRFLAGPLGQATLMGAFDSSGHLDTSRVSFEPGVAFHNAAMNMSGSGSPMRKLMEFAGRSSRLASETSPEDVMLGQLGMGLEFARMASPHGPVTNDLLVGAMSYQGVDPETARAMVGASQVMGENLQAKRQQIVLQARANAESNGVIRGGETWAESASKFASGVGGTTVKHGLLGAVALGAAGLVGGFTVGVPALVGFAGAAALSVATGGSPLNGLTDGAVSMLSEMGTAGSNRVRNFFPTGLKSAISVDLGVGVHDSIHNSVVQDLLASKLVLGRPGMETPGVDKFNSMLSDLVSGPDGKTRNLEGIQRALGASALDIGQFQGDSGGEAFDALVGRTIKRGTGLDTGDEAYIRSTLKGVVGSEKQLDFQAYGKLHAGQALMEGADYTVRQSISDDERTYLEKRITGAGGDPSVAGRMAGAVGVALADDPEARKLFMKRRGGFSDIARLFDKFGKDGLDVSDPSKLGDIGLLSVTELQKIAGGDKNPMLSKEEFKDAILASEVNVTRKRSNAPEVAGSGDANLPKILQDLAQTQQRLANFLNKRDGSG